MNNTFSFTGTLSLPKENSKRPFVSEKTAGANKLPALSMNFGIKESDTNSAYVELFGMKTDTIKTMDTDNQKIEIDWDDRFDKDIIAQVANYKKFVVAIDDERHEFITAYDMIEYLKDNLPKYKGKLTVTGTYERSEWKGKYYDRFTIQNVFAADEEKRNRLAMTLDLYYNKECVDTSDYKSEKKIYINGYLSQYSSADKENRFYPVQVIFNASKYDTENEKHMKLLDYKLGYVKIGNKTMQHLAWECVLVRGAETKEITMEDLTDAQKQQVELGIRDLQYFAPRGIVGDKVNEIRLFDPILRDMAKSGNISDGLVDAGYSNDEFDELIFVPNAVEEKLEDVEEKKTEKKSENKENESSKKSDDDGVIAAPDDGEFDLF